MKKNLLPKSRLQLSLRKAAKRIRVLVPVETFPRRRPRNVWNPVQVRTNSKSLHLQERMTVGGTVSWGFGDFFWKMSIKNALKLAHRSLLGSPLLHATADV